MTHIPGAVALDPRHVSAAMFVLATTAESHLSDESGICAGPSFVFPCALQAHTYLLVDVLYDRNHRWVLVEANGSNAAGSSAHDGDVPRVQHFVDTIEARRLGGDAVVIAYQNGTPCTPEIHTRAALIASVLQARYGRRVRICDSKDAGVGSDMTVVVGTTERIADELTVTSAGRLKWRNRSVVGASNANVLPALVRKRRIGSIADVDPTVFHEGELVSVVADKGVQQTIATGTGLRSLRWQSAASPEELVERIAAWSDERACVAKMRWGSGGTGVIVVARGTSRSCIEAMLALEMNRVVRKYGSDVTAWPFNIFEFATAMPARHSTLEGPRLWDMRLEVIVRPGQIVVTPLAARLCPRPYTGTPTNASAVANQTGRHDGASRVLGADDLVAAIGESPSILGDVASAAARWMVSAVRSVRCAG